MPLLGLIRRITTRMTHPRIMDWHWVSKPRWRKKHKGTTRAAFFTPTPPVHGKVGWKLQTPKLGFQDLKKGKSNPFQSFSHQHHKGRSHSKQSKMHRSIIPDVAGWLGHHWCLSTLINNVASHVVWVGGAGVTSLTRGGRGPSAVVCLVDLSGSNMFEIPQNQRNHWTYPRHPATQQKHNDPYWLGMSSFSCD